LPLYSSLRFPYKLVLFMHIRIDLFTFSPCMVKLYLAAKFGHKKCLLCVLYFKFLWVKTFILGRNCGH
jgi:hypothetical protein